MAFAGAHAQPWNFRPGTRSQARTYLEGLVGQETRGLRVDDVAFARGTAVRAVAAAAGAEDGESSGEGSQADQDEVDFGAAPGGLLALLPVAESAEREESPDSGERGATSLYQTTWAGTRDYTPQPAPGDAAPPPGGALAALRARVAALAGEAPPGEAGRHAAVGAQPDGAPAGKPAARPLADRQLALSGAAGASARRGAPAPAPVRRERPAPADGGQAEEDFLGVMSAWVDDPAQLQAPRRRPQAAAGAAGAAPAAAPGAPAARGLQDAAEPSRLLAGMRRRLAEDKVGRAPSEYASLCQFLQEQGGDWKALQVASVADVRRAARVPEALGEPVVVDARSNWRPRRWSMAFWSYECGQETCWSHRRSPPCAGDAGGGQPARPVPGSVSDFVKYVGVLRDLGPRLAEEDYLAYPRFSVGGWSPFATEGGEGRALWEEDLRSGRQSWAPAGVKDLTDRWVKMFCNALSVDWKETLACMDAVQLGPAGAVTRLHVAPASAHTWHGQIQGRRAFVLFAPHESGNLYAEGGEGSDDEGDAGDVADTAAPGLPPRDLPRALRRSPVDVLRPSKGLTSFKKSAARVVVLEPGEILVVPQGWWLYSATLEPSATLSRRFWNHANREGVCEELEFLFRPGFEAREGRQEGRARLRSYVEQLRYKQQQDYSSDED